MDAVVSKNQLTVNAILRFIQKSSLESIATIPGVRAEIFEIIARNHSKITKKKLRNMTFPRFALVGAVRREDEVFIPTGDTQIRPGDRVVVIALPNAVADVEKLF
jgi:trk system potassium uptake protein TrkA